MRIIAGSKRGSLIAAPKGMDTRPTLSRVKESLFGILQFGIPGKRALDLFAGSGSLGLEALSRGAAHVVFCDSARQAAEVVRANLQKLGFTARASVYACDYAAALRTMAAKGERVDIAFLDPPYASGLAEKALHALAHSGLLQSGYVLVVEHAPSLPPVLPQGMRVCDTRRYGEVALSFIREDAR
ncbi:MAG: 16S rRNA (guanine(966)-N(2))-methyltransferase RsmD [Christensenellaceae bacterium]|nr:16S rRNA (guanine(966)-N(2))-methyltransferase RsmD [Christensenellaceae bacterium]